MSTVYLNGSYLPKDEARISVDDRGFLLSDGIYEVAPAYQGRLFRLTDHVERMRRGLRELRIEFDPSLLGEIGPRLIEENDLEDEETSLVYIQATRGVAPRTHHFPDGRTEPTVYAFARPFRRPPSDEWEQGFPTIIVPDRRWARVDIKSTALLPNVLAQQAAVEAGATDALLVKDGIAIEGAHSNFFAVLDGTVVTHPKSNVILHGITRGYVLELARGLGLPVEERPIQLEELTGAEEAFFTGTTTEIRPVAKIDGRPVGEGRTGPVTLRLFRAFLEGVAAATAPASARA